MMIRFFMLILFAIVLGGTASGEQCDVDNDRPSVWLGDEADDFYCKADTVHCPYFGLDYVCEDPNGGSLEPCVNGTKIKCASQAPAHPVADPTPATELRVLAYNVFELRFLYWQNGQRERTCRILHEVFALHPDLDVIIFNEVFMGGCFAPFNSSIETSVLTIRDILDQYGFYYYTETVGVGYLQGLQLENGGAFIASRWPIVKNASHVFQSIEFYEFMAKGVVYAMIDKTVDGVSMNYHVFGTHMQAFRTKEADNVRVAQAVEIHDLMQMQDIAEDEPVIYGGDLNARKGTENGDLVVQALDATLPPLVGDLDVTYDAPNNDMFLDKNSTSWWLDYVLYSNSHVQPLSSTVRVVRPLLTPPIEVCNQEVSLTAQPIYANSERCRNPVNISDMSDHYAVLGTFQYPQKAEPPTQTASTTGSGAEIYVFNKLLVCLLLIVAFYA